MPLWVPLALFAPALYSVVFVLDKIIVDRYSPTTYSYAFATGLMELAIGSTIFLIVSQNGMEPQAMLGGALAGGTLAIGFLILLLAIRRGQVARVVPIWSLAPLMVAPMAAGFLGERLSALAAVAIVLAVAGSAMVSWQRPSSVRGPSFGSPVVLASAAGSALLNAVSLVLAKYFLDRVDFWQFYASFRVFFSVWMLMVIFAPEVRRSLGAMARSREFIGLVVLNLGVVVSISHGIRFAAVSMGPVSLVSALSSAQPAVVFLYSLGLAALAPAFFGGWITRATIKPQVAGIAAVTASVVLISLD